MQVLIRQILKKEDERVVIECVEMTKDFEDINCYFQHHFWNWAYCELTEWS